MQEQVTDDTLESVDEAEFATPSSATPSAATPSAATSSEATPRTEDQQASSSSARNVEFGALDDRRLTLREISTPTSGGGRARRNKKPIIRYGIDD